ncbi:MAG: translocation/assembly module TamB [Flavobacteriales bacterium]|nr:translocation/assembly module TamB [Flavobacteriales bacterium]
MFRILLRTVVVLLLMTGLLAGLFMVPAVQTWLGAKLSAQLAKDLGVTIRVDRLELRIIGPNRFHGLYIEDLHGDTLVAARELWVRGLKVHPRNRVIRVRQLELVDGRFAMDRLAGEPHSNLTEFLAKISGTPSTDTTYSKPWTIECATVDVRGLHYSYFDAGRKALPFGVDVDHVDIPDATVIGKDFKLHGDSMKFQVAELRFSDRSGLVVEHLSGFARVGPPGIFIDGLRLVTGPQAEGMEGSTITGDLGLRTETLSDFDEFNTKVFMDARLDSSRIQAADVALFAPDLEGIDLAVSLKGHIQGTVSQLKGRGMDLYFGERSAFRGDVELTGLPDVPNTFIVLDATEVHTNPTDLARLPIPPFTSKGKLQLPVEVQRLGDLSYSGNFTGFVNSFTTYGTATTGAGTLVSDISYERDTISRAFRLNGKLSTDGFNLGRVLGTTSVGHIAFRTKVSAKGKDLNSLVAELEGDVPVLELEKYGITGITLNGKLEKNLFNGELHCTDPKLQLDFNGLADLRGRWPQVDFSADVHRMDLRALGVIEGSGYSDLSMHVAAKGRLSPDSLEGTVRMENVSYCEDSIDLELGNIALDSWREDGVPKMRLESTMADAQVEGPFHPVSLPGAVSSVFLSVFPALSDRVAYEQVEQNFSFAAQIKEAQPLLDIVLPGLKVANGTAVSGHFNSTNFDMGLDGTSPAISYGGFGGDSLEFSLGKTLDVLAFSLTGNGETRKDSLRLSKLIVTGTAYQDELRFRADWATADSMASGVVRLAGLVRGPDSFSLDLEPSSVALGRGEWHNPLTAHFELDSGNVHLDSLEMVNGTQRIRLGGAMGKSPLLAASFQLHDVRLENTAPLFDGPALHGSVSGDGKIFDLLGDPYLLSYLCVDSLAIEDKPVGDLQLAAAYNDGGEGIAVHGNLHRGALQMLGFTGNVTPGKAQELALRLNMDSLDLRFLDPYLPEAISDIQGLVSGHVNVTGKLSDPQIEGTALLENAGLRINYLNTFYSFTHQVDIQPDMFALDLVKLHDDEGHEAVATGTIIHHGLKDWNFDLGLEMDNMKVLQTTINDNQLYYGKAYAKGRLGLSGYADNIFIDVDAATGPGTDIHFPLGASRDVSGISFVRFAEGGSSASEEQTAVDLSGIQLNMKIAVTPDAQFELIFDPTVGDIMRGRGTGDITMSVTPAGDFSMKGDVELTEGDYLFTLRNLVNKKFGVEPGGRISWFGDPFDALINIDAVYKLRASLYDVMPAALRTEAYKKRVPVEVLMHLSQRLMNPDIAFDVRLPSVDEGVRTQVNSALANTDDMNKQVFALIVLNRFLPNDANSGGQENSGLAVGATTGTELLSNQVSNWLSSVSNKFDFGVNWRTGDAISQDEVELAVSTAVFNDRLQLSTNVGVSYGDGGTQQGTNNIIGDFSAEYSLTQDGKLRFKAFSQSNDRNLNQVDQAQTTQGAGLAYREEFDTVGEFFRKVGRIFTGK